MNPLNEVICGKREIERVMADIEADMQEVTERSGKEATNKEARALLKAMPELVLGLSLSIQTIALHCYAKEIIPPAVYEGMFEGEWKADNSRAYYFINCILNKLKKHEDSNSGEVERIIRQLTRIVRHNSALEHIAQTIGKNYYISLNITPQVYKHPAK